MTTATNAKDTVIMAFAIINNLSENSTLVQLQELSADLESIL